jgi:hypothetical protein
MAQGILGTVVADGRSYSQNIPFSFRSRLGEMMPSCPQWFGLDKRSAAAD